MNQYHGNLPLYFNLEKVTTVIYLDISFYNRTLMALNNTKAQVDFKALVHLIHPWIQGALVAIVAWVALPEAVFLVVCDPSVNNL